MKKRIVLLLASLVMMLSLAATVFAEDSVVAKEISFETMISRYFDNKDSTIVLDKNGVDITNVFFAQNQSFYDAGDYNAIRDFLNINVDSLKCSIETIGSTRMDVSKSVSDYETFLIESKGHRGFLTMAVGGTIIYNRNTGEISKAYNPKLLRTEYSDFYGWSFQNKNITTKSWISTDKYTGYFSARMRTIGKYEKSLEDFDFGYHECTVTAQGGD